MTAIIVATGDTAAAAIADDLRDEGARIIAVCAPDDVDKTLLEEADAVLLPATRSALTPALVAACDRARVRIVPIGGDDGRLLARLGLPDALPVMCDAAEILAAIAGRTTSAHDAGAGRSRRVIAVWGPHGAPGRSTVAIQLAAELAIQGGRTALIDADTHAPSLALLLGLGDDTPGIAAACRRADLGDLDVAELDRLCSAVPVQGTTIDVLAGINRPSRWPELAAHRLRAALRACRGWADDTVVDTAAAIESDEEITSDTDGPRRNAASITALTEADAIVAVACAEPLGVARFLHSYSELRALAGATPVTVVVNRARSGPLGLDGRKQVRQTLDRFAGIRDVHFLPDDRRASDAGLLHAKPLVEVAPRSPLIAAIRRVAQSLPQPTDETPATASDLRAAAPRKRRLLARR